jgi:hypothetical protein
MKSSMGIRSRLTRLEIGPGAICPECSGLPGPDASVELRITEAHPDKPRPEPKRSYCPRCELPTEWRIRVQGMKLGTLRLV